MKILFINDSTSSPNWGDRAAAVSLRKMISETGGDIVATITEDQLKHGSLFPTDVRDRAKQRVKLFLPPILLGLRRKFMQQLEIPNEPHSRIPTTWEGFPQLAEEAFLDNSICPELIKGIREADMAVIHGDGAMVGNGPVPRTDMFIGYLIKKHFGKPVIIVNHTADFDHPGLRKIAEQVYPLFDDVVFRDPTSVERCRSLCPGRFAPDTAFLFEPMSRDLWAPMARRLTYLDVWPDTAQFDPAAPYLCVGGSSKFDYETEPFPVRKGYAALIQHLMAVYNGQVVLTASDLTDESVFRPIASQLSLPLVGVTIPVQQAVDILGNADAYIGGRWHPGIFALSGGAPIIPLSAKTFKMQSLASLAGFPSTAFDVFSLASQKELITEQLFGYLREGAGLRHMLRQWALGMRDASWDNVSYLSNLDQASSWSFQRPFL